MSDGFFFGCQSAVDCVGCRNQCAADDVDVDDVDGGGVQGRLQKSHFVIGFQGWDQAITVPPMTLTKYVNPIDTGTHTHTHTKSMHNKIYFSLFQLPPPSAFSFSPL